MKRRFRTLLLWTTGDKVLPPEIYENIKKNNTFKM